YLHPFVLGRNIEEAMKQAQSQVQEGYRYSYDMLGEAARTQADADKYYQAYYDAITKLGQSNISTTIYDAPCMSVKLSALHPRYEYRQREWIVPILVARIKTLALHAKANHLSLTIDAEEAELLDLSLDIFEMLLKDPAFTDWDGLGLAVQAYQKRAVPLIKWLIDLARKQGSRIPVRLVKGAYWDTEIKRAQMEGLEDYPVFTRKVNTDISYLACAKLMLAAQDVIYPQFATHNAYSVAAILTLMGNNYRDYEFEFQNLQGMGKALHDHIVRKDQMDLPCRIYAPVGSHEELLPYLVRRLLENGANSSFVNQIADRKTPIEKLVISPMAKLKKLGVIANPKISLPKNLFGKNRVNSMGFDFSHLLALENLMKAMEVAGNKTWEAAPFSKSVTKGKSIINPMNHQQLLGRVEEATVEDIKKA
ncbi:MAG TPA: proline dehydrogenase family protein, partial [Gammaproteobacteria bacterium]|nr:proline dehydrogenase family protein [Gammaproteobacteria bacterium]